MTLAVTLASRSPQRIALLSRLDLTVTVQPSGVEEDRVAMPDAPAGKVRALALAKARDVAATSPGIVLGADTLVALDDTVLGKPGTPEAATAMLHRLSGRRHEVLTGLAVIAGREAPPMAPVTIERARRIVPDLALEVVAGRPVLTAVVTSAVTFRPLSDEQIRTYVVSGEPLDKAGAYGIQGAGAALVAALDGCFTNVVGLPLCAAAALLSLAAGRHLACPADAECRPSCLCEGDLSS